MLHVLYIIHGGKNNGGLCRVRGGGDGGVGGDGDGGDGDSGDGDGGGVIYIRKAEVESAREAVRDDAETAPVLVLRVGTSKTRTKRRSSLPTGAIFLRYKWGISLWAPLMRIS